MRSRRRRMPACRVLVTGSRGAGKSCLLQTFLSGTFKQTPRGTGSQVERKVFTVGCQDIEYLVQEPPGEGEEFAAAARLANTVLLCYRASDVMSLHEAVNKWLPLVRRHHSDIPVVLVGCQGDNKVYGTNTMLETDPILQTANVVMHVETSATISKSVNVAFQVAALACLEHKSKEGERDGDCTLQPVLYAQSSKVRVNLNTIKERTMEEIYANLPGIKRDEKELEIIDIPAKQETDLLKVKTQCSSEPEKACKQTKNGVAIECQRLNKNKVLEKISVEVSPEVFEALQQMNPNLTIKTTKNTWNVLDFDSANFCIGKSMRDVKSVVEWVRSWKTGPVSKYSFSKQKVTSL